MATTNFARLLEISTKAPIDFAKRFITNKTGTSISYCVYLNNSYDGPLANDLSKFSLHPEDEGKYYHRISTEKVIDLLCRENQIPVWIDISVVAASPHETTMRLLCAGRYSREEEEYYYHQKQETGPFGIKSPNLPYGYVEGELFTLHKRYWWNRSKGSFYGNYRKVNWWRL